MSGTRRMLDELIMLHELEPTLREIVVEGRSDAGVLRTFLRGRGIVVDVFAVDDRVDVSGELVEAAGLKIGARGRVLTIAQRVKSRDVKNSLTLVVDADFHFAEPEKFDGLECLLLSDFGALECYCLESSVLEHFLEVALRAPRDVVASSVLDATVDALVDIFLARLILGSLDDPPAMVEKIEKRFAIQSGKLVVNLEKLLRDSLRGRTGAKDGKQYTVADLLVELESRRSKLAGDMRKYVRGHDISRVLVYYLFSNWPQLFAEDRLAFKTSTTFEIALLCCLDMHMLAEYSLFNKLLERVVAA